MEMEKYQNIFNFMRADAGWDKTIFTPKSDKYIYNGSFYDICNDDYSVNLSSGKLTNAFWLPNRGEWQQVRYTSWEDQIQEEGRKKINIKKYHFFYFDFDLKDNDNEHYHGDELIKEKEQLLSKIEQLPLEPNYIVLSRNGYHIYYTIAKENRNMSSIQWHAIEIQMFNWIYDNITTCVDHAVKKSNQILRVPISYHIKKDSEKFFVHPISMLNYTDALQKLHNKQYAPGMYSYSLQELTSAFKTITTVKHIYESNKTRPGANMDELKLSDKTISTKTVSEKIIDKSKKLSSYNNNKLISDIHANKSSNNNRLSSLINGKAFHSYQEATEFIRNIDLRSILDINTELNEKVKSLFYTDDDPSDWFFKNKNGKIVYICNRDGRVYNDIFQITARVQYTDSFPDLDKNEWSNVYKFVYDIFSINILADWKKRFDLALEKNLQAFDNLIKHSKQTKWMKAYKEVYQTLMILWKEHVYDNNISWKECKRDLSQEWLSSEVEKRTDKKKSKQDITRCLLVFRRVGILKQVESKYSSNKLLSGTKGMVESVNRYQFLPIYSASVFNEIVSKCEFIRSKLDKPSIQVSEKKLEEIFIDYYIDKLNK